VSAPFTEQEPCRPQEDPISGSWSRRFQRQLSDGSWQVVTLEFYVSDADSDEPALVRNHENVICPDPARPDRVTSYDASATESVPTDSVPTAAAALTACAALRIEDIEIEFGDPVAGHVARLRGDAEHVASLERERDQLKALLDSVQTHLAAAKTERWRDVSDALVAGLPSRDVADLAGIGYSTLKDRLQQQRGSNS
jgi:hypothetical protein